MPDRKISRKGIISRLERDSTAFREEAASLDDETFTARVLAALEPPEDGDGR